jgi:lysophospholipase L1-like esterase
LAVDKEHIVQLLWIPALWVSLTSLRFIQKGEEIVFPKSLKYPSTGKSLLVIGDSHTGSYASWGEQLNKRGNFGSFAKRAEVGKTTSWMLAQLRDYLGKNKAPDYILVWGGANDAYGSTSQATTLGNMQAMIDTARSVGSKLIFVSGYDPAKVSYNFNTTGLIGTETTLGQGRNRWIAILDSMPKKLKGYSAIIPKHPYFTRSNSTDGLHLTYNSYVAFGNWVADNYFKP